MLAFDHIAVSGETLEAATAYVEDALGVSLQPGGEHAVFHTHNTLLGLADGLYLEAIATNPNAPRPDRARWFDLDRFVGAPRLTNWICRAPDLDAALSQIAADLGKPVDLQRGDLRWRMAVPTSGQLPFDNCAPALIQWQTRTHPADRLTQCGCRLRRLVVSHPQAREMRNVLSPSLQDARLVFQQGPAGLLAEVETPHGVRELGG